MKKDPKIFLEHILECLHLLERYAKGLSKKELELNKMVLDAILRRIEIIGEAAKELPNDFKVRHSDIPWKDMAGMRDILIHQYYGVEVDEIWQVLKRDAPDLKKQIKTLLRNLEKLK